MNADKKKVSEDLFRLETALHRREVRNSPAAVSELLAEDFTEFGSSGRIWNKTSIIHAMEKEDSGPSVLVQQFLTRELAPDVVLVTYIAWRNADRDTKTATLRSSIWKLIEGRWQMVFHQGTRSAEAPK